MANEQEYLFARYRNGQLMAEGASTVAGSKEAARDKVLRRYRGSMNQAGQGWMPDDIFVLIATVVTQDPTEDEHNG